KERALLKGHAQGLNSLSFAPDGLTLATGSSDRNIKLWDVGSAKERTSLWEYTGDSLAFLSDGKAVVSGSSHGTVYLWDMYGSRTGGGKVVGPKVDPLKALAVSPDGKTLALAGNDGRLILWSLAAGKEIRQWHLPGVTNGLAFAGDSRHLLCL